jgi:hypothetical protein
MPKTYEAPPIEPEVKTGRRENPAVDGPRDKTVCFMLSDREKHSVDRLALCMNLTRSGVLARIVTEFVTATDDSKAGRIAEKEMGAYLAECRQAIKKRAAFADKTLTSMKGSQR